jgi:hypothetical protein
MNLEEYLKLSKNLDSSMHNSSSPDPYELTQFVTVWVKSKQPALFNQLQTEFKDIEGDIYAYNEEMMNKINIF